MCIVIFLNLCNRFNEHEFSPGIERIEIYLSDDFIMTKDQWNAPIVIPKYNIILWVIPKVASTILKRVVARMYNYDNWRYGWF